MGGEGEEPEIIATEVLEHPQAVTDRSAARRLALQILYEIDCTAHLPGIVMTNRFQEDSPSRKIENHVRQLVSGVIAYRDKLDAIIQRYATEFPLHLVAIVDRNILRLGAYEFALREIPINVVAAEAVELANMFGADGSTRFINGVMGAISEDEALRQMIPPESGE
jgi:N utilization substance protein B